MNYNETSSKTLYMREGMEITNFMPYPRFLPASSLSSTAKEVYVLLLHRSNLSRHNNWIDDQGRVFVLYTLDQLSRNLEKSKTTIKAALNELCNADLLERKRRGRGLANYLYVKLPPENLIPINAPKAAQKVKDDFDPDHPVSFPSITGSENRPPDSRKTGHNQVGKLTPSKKKEGKDISHLKRRFRDYSYKEGESL